MKERFEAINGLRALACVGIILMHVMSNNVVKPSLNFLTENIISFSGDFVLMFMMVSAFSLCCGYYQRFKDGTVSLDDFYSKRYKRILPFFSLLVLIDVLFCTANEHFLFTTALRTELWEGFADLTLAFGLIPGNGISVIGVGWFLGVIFMFYMLFPFFVFLIGNIKKAISSFLIVLGLYFSVKFYFFPEKGVIWTNSSIMRCAPYFLIGGIIFLLRNNIKNTNSIVRCLIFLLNIVYTVLFFYFPKHRFELSNLILYALWLIYAISEICPHRKWTLLNNKIMAFISEISMEIYLSHMLIFRVVEKLHLERFINNQDFVYILTCLMVVAGTIGFALVWKSIEKRLKFIKN